MLRDWLVEHPHVLAVFLLVLAALNGWISYHIFPQHPLLALANAAMALILALGVLVTWRVGGSP